MTSSKLNSEFIINIQTITSDKRNCIIDIISCIEKNEWNQAKSLWLVYGLDLKHDFSCECDLCKEFFNRKTVSKFGSEYEFFMQPMIQIQKYNLISFCSNDCELNMNLINSVSLNFVKNTSGTSLLLSKNKKCRLCKSKLSFDLQFLYSAPWI